MTIRQYASMRILLFLCISKIILFMKTLIWDYNGTIIDDVEMCLRIENGMMERRQMAVWPQSLEAYRDAFCFPVIDYYYKLGYTFENETYEDISVEFNDLYKEHFHECGLMDGFEDKITEAIDKGYRNVILSASRHDALNAQCRKLGIEKYFDEILGIDNYLAGSKIDMALQWMKNSGTSPDECMYIGDTQHDYDTAKALGISHIVLISCGHQSERVLRQYCENVVPSLREVNL